MEIQRIADYKINDNFVLQRLVGWNKIGHINFIEYASTCE